MLSRNGSVDAVTKRAGARIGSMRSFPSSERVQRFAGFVLHAVAYPFAARRGTPLPEVGFLRGLTAGLVLSGVFGLVLAGAVVATGSATIGDLHLLAGAFALIVLAPMLWFAVTTGPEILARCTSDATARRLPAPARRLPLSTLVARGLLALVALSTGIELWGSVASGVLNVHWMLAVPVALPVLARVRRLTVGTILLTVGVAMAAEVVTPYEVQIAHTGRFDARILKIAYGLHPGIAAVDDDVIYRGCVVNASKKFVALLEF